MEEEERNKEVKKKREGKENREMKAGLFKILAFK